MPGNIAKEIDALQQMTTSELAERYEDLYGQPVRTRHRAYLIRKVAWRIQANAEGGGMRGSLCSPFRSSRVTPTLPPMGGGSIVVFGAMTRTSASSAISAARCRAR